MKKEIIATGRTIEAAVSNGAAELGVEPERVTYEVVEQPKKGFLGFGEAPAKVKITYMPGAEDSALEFIRTLLSDMELEATAELAHELSSSGDRLIRISGESAGVLIGHHGDTLDSLQCLVNLAANRGEDEDGDGYTRISVDIENYRAKREETLRRLARNMAMKVKKYRKNVTLEPMNPYERRIIHSEVQGIEGVSTVSVGADSGRRVVIYLEELGKPTGRPMPNSQDRAPANKPENSNAPAANADPAQKQQNQFNRRPRRPAPKPESGDTKQPEAPTRNFVRQDIRPEVKLQNAIAMADSETPSNSSVQTAQSIQSEDIQPNSTPRQSDSRPRNNSNQRPRSDYDGANRRPRGDYNRNRMDDADKATPADRERYSRPRNFDRPRPPKKSNTEDIINKTIESYLKTELPKAEPSPESVSQEPNVQQNTGDESK